MLHWHKTQQENLEVVQIEKLKKQHQVIEILILNQVD